MLSISDFYYCIYCESPDWNCSMMALYEFIVACISSSRSLNCFLYLCVSFYSCLRWAICVFKSCLTNSSSNIVSERVYYWVWFFELKLLGNFELPTINAHKFWSSTKLMILELMKYDWAAKHLIVRQIKSLDSRDNVLISSFISKWGCASPASELLCCCYFAYFDIRATISMAVPDPPPESLSLY